MVQVSAPMERCARICTFTRYKISVLLINSCVARWHTRLRLWCCLCLIRCSLLTSRSIVLATAALLTHQGIWSWLGRGRCSSVRQLRWMRLSELRLTTVCWIVTNSIHLACIMETSVAWVIVLVMRGGGLCVDRLLLQMHGLSLVWPRLIKSSMYILRILFEHLL